MFKTTHLFLIAFYLFTSSLTQIIANDEKEKIKIKVELFEVKDDPLLYGVCTMNRPENTYTFSISTENISGNEFIYKFIKKETGKTPEKKVAAPGAIDEPNTVELRESNFIEYLPLYPIYLYGDYALTKTMTSYFRMPKIKYEELNKEYKLDNVYPKKLSYNRQNTMYWYDEDDKVEVDISLNSEVHKVETVKSKWHELFKIKLTSDINNNIENELEVLLYMKFFKELPSNNINYGRQDSFLYFAKSITGYNDVRSAIPYGEDAKISIETYTEQPAEPITLPHVPVDEKALENAKLDEINKWVPRSCYYLEFKDYPTMKQTIGITANQFNKWLLNNYPTDPTQLMEHYLGLLGITKEYEESNLIKNNVKVSVFGWDPYFQMSTSIGLVISSEKEIKPPKDRKLFFQANSKTIILANSPKLLEMAQKCFANKTSLNQVENFQYSRNLFSKNTDETEYGFMYLSDYWLTNFISPRWQILSKRLINLDARIKFVQLIEKIYQTESNLKSAPSLEELKAKNVLVTEMNEWLFKDLIKENGVIKDKTLGGRLDHPPIDQIKFDLVSPVENKEYNDFKMAYERNWRQMDPLAFQIAQDKNKKWKTRLYISPISNFSSFRQIRNFVLDKKVTHAFEKIPGQAIGLSVVVKTSGLNMFGVNNVSLSTFVQLLAFDFAPSSFTPSYWLKNEYQQDEISYYRVPAFAVVPSWLGSIGMLQGVLGNQANSDFKDINQIHISSQEFPLFIYDQKDNGKTFIGFNPTSLTVVRDRQKADAEQDTDPSDIRLFLDFKNGYNLKKKAMQELTKNRGLESWKIRNQYWRLGVQLGYLDKTRDDSKKIWEDINGILFKYPDKFLFEDIPLDKNSSSNSYSSDVSNSFKKLPELIYNLKRADIFISLFDNSLLFETHYDFGDFSFLKSNEDDLIKSQKNGESNEQKNQGLDFDK